MSDDEMKQVIPKRVTENTKHVGKPTDEVRNTDLNHQIMTNSHFFHVTWSITGKKPGMILSE